MIEARGLSRRFGSREAVVGLSFSVRRGEIVGLLGPNGAGKTTTMRMLTGFLPPSDGDAIVAGASVVEDPLAVQARVGYLPENNPLYRELCVRDHLRFIGRLRGMPEGTLRDRMREVAEACGLREVMGRRIEELSKGYRQRVGLACCLLHDPDLLILDEPTTGLDPNQVMEVRALIKDLAARKTVLLSTHILSEVEAVCDRVMIMEGGRLRAIGTVAELVQMAAGKALVRVKIAEGKEAARAALAEALAEATVEEKEDGVLLVAAEMEPEALARAIWRALREAPCELVALVPEQTPLEEVFRRLTGEGQA